MTDARKIALRNALTCANLAREVRYLWCHTKSFEVQPCAPSSKGKGYYMVHPGAVRAAFCVSGLQDAFQGWIEL